MARNDKVALLLHLQLGGRDNHQIAGALGIKRFTLQIAKELEIPKACSDEQIFKV